MGMSSANKSYFAPLLKGEKRFPELMNKSEASIYLRNKIDFSFIDNLLQARDNKGRKLYPIVAIYLEKQTRPVFRKEDLDKTVELLSKNQLEKNETVKT